MKNQQEQLDYPILVSGAGKMGQEVMKGVIEEDYPIMDMAVAFAINPFYVAGQKFFTIPSWEYSQFLCMLMMHKETALIIDAVPGTNSQGNLKLYSQYPKVPKIIMSSGIKDKTIVKNTLFLENACLEILAFELFLKMTEIDLSGDNYFLAIIESHQASKVDASGTAKKFIPHFNKWGLNFEAADMVSVRDPEQQLFHMGIPEAFLGAHAYHGYSIFSKDQNDTKLKSLFDLAKSYFTNNQLFVALDCSDVPDMLEEADEKSIHSILWSNDLVDEIYSSLMFTLSFIEYKDGRKEIRFEHLILGRQPYVDGVIKHAIPFMKERIVTGLNGENFSTSDLYNWVLSKKIPELRSSYVV